MINPNSNKLTNTLLERINSTIDEIENLERLMNFLNVSSSNFNFIEELNSFLKKLIEEIRNKNPDEKYLNQFLSLVTQIFTAIPYRGQQNQIINNIKNIQNNRFYNSQNPVDSYKKQIESSLSNLANIYNNLKFLFDFFKKLDFFSKNIVIVGPNGSGKTLFANTIKTKFALNNAIVISAQRILRIPNLNAIHNPENTLSQLKNIQSQDKTAKSEQSISTLNNEFTIILQHLIAENTKKEHEFVKKFEHTSEIEKSNLTPPQTTLKKAIKIWKELIPHRELDIKDGIRLVVKDQNIEYEPIRLSEGEKDILYVTAQVLQAPEKSFIIIDEPEMHLHKAILIKLWDKLEEERKDCKFIYLTHDLDFAVSRIDAKKIWMKSFIYPETFQMEEIPSNEIPEKLLLEILGSRKPILFCEGENSSLDRKIFEILFPKYTIIPSGSFVNVINFTKAFNKLESFTQNKAYGIIDKDFRSKEEIEYLASHHIFTLEYAEIENLLFIEDLLMEFAKETYISNSEEAIENIKEKIMESLMEEKELHITRYIVSKINEHFSHTFIEKSKNKSELKNKFREFVSKVDVDELYKNIEGVIDKALKDRDYSQIIKIFKNKGKLIAIANTELRIKDFQDRIINFIRLSEKPKEILYSNLPQKLVESYEKLLRV